MNNIKQYITEKLKLNKDIKVNDYISNYQEGDNCLLLWYNSNLKNSKKDAINIVPIRIKSIDLANKQFEFKQLSLYQHEEKNLRNWNNVLNIHDEYIIYDDGKPVFGDVLTIGVIIPNNKCLSFLKNLEKHYFVLDFQKEFNYTSKNITHFNHAIVVDIFSIAGDTSSWGKFKKFEVLMSIYE